MDVSCTLPCLSMVQFISTIIPNILNTIHVSRLRVIQAPRVGLGSVQYMKREQTLWRPSGRMDLLATVEVTDLFFLEEWICLQLLEWLIYFYSSCICGSDQAILPRRRHLLATAGVTKLFFLEEEICSHLWEWLISSSWKNGFACNCGSDQSILPGRRDLLATVGVTELFFLEAWFCLQLWEWLI